MKIALMLLFLFSFSTQLIATESWVNVYDVQSPSMASIAAVQMVLLLQVIVTTSLLLLGF
jgi:hypothetical protein